MILPLRAELDSLGLLLRSLRRPDLVLVSEVFKLPESPPPSGFLPVSGAAVSSANQRPFRPGFLPESSLFVPP